MLGLGSRKFISIT